MSLKTNPEVFCVPVQRTNDEIGIIGLGKNSEVSREGEWYLPSGEPKGSGVFGEVHEVCKKDNCDYVMKIIKLKPPGGERWSERRLQNVPGYTRENFLKEVELQKEAFDLKVAPEIIDSWICENPLIGVIIMPALQRTLSDVIGDSTVKEEEKEKYIKDGSQILHILAKNNIVHGDAHLSNFMIDDTGKLNIIDFGQAKKIVRRDDVIKPKHNSRFFLTKTPQYREDNTFASNYNRGRVWKNGNILPTQKKTKLTRRRRRIKPVKVNFTAV